MHPQSSFLARACLVQEASVLTDSQRLCLSVGVWGVVRADASSYEELLSMATTKPWLLEDCLRKAAEMGLRQKAAQADLEGQLAAVAPKVQRCSPGMQRTAAALPQRGPPRRLLGRRHAP